MSVLQGRPRKPVEMLEASGAFQKNPNRRREPSPKSNHPIGDAPEYLNPAERVIFHEFLLELPMGVATAPDCSALALLCMLENNKRMRSIKLGEMQILIKLYSLFGITPSDRSRVILVPDQEKNPFGEF